MAGDDALTVIRGAWSCRTGGRGEPLALRTEPGGAVCCLP